MTLGWTIRRFGLLPYSNYSMWFLWHCQMFLCRADVKEKPAIWRVSRAAFCFIFVFLYWRARYWIS